MTIVFITLGILGVILYLSVCFTAFAIVETAAQFNFIPLIKDKTPVELINDISFTPFRAITRIAFFLITPIIAVIFLASRVLKWIIS
jgi:hypothetical protein